MLKLSALALLLIQGAVYAFPADQQNRSKGRESCRTIPTDTTWPRQEIWNRLNASVSGRLIEGKPLGSVCHGNEYDDAACAVAREQWSIPDPYFPDPVNIMSPYWQNNSCSPFTAPNTSCTLGNLPSYAINVTSIDDVKAGINFAKKKNVRLAVKNTGHDYLGRSTGEGAVSLWMHNLKSISFMNYTSPGYSGPAVKIGAGVQFYELYDAAAAKGLRVVGGYCPTVGIAGGYLPGGGHGPLGATYGLGADNTLEFEVITTDGLHLVASPTRHSDLYWALSGGGAGVYAIVLSVTVKGHADGPVAGATFSFNNTNDDAYFSAIQAWQTHLLDFDKVLGLNTLWHFTKEMFSLDFTTWPGANTSAMEDALAPFLRELNSLGLEVESYEATTMPRFWDHYGYYTGSLPYGPYAINDVLGGRIIPRSTVSNSAANLTDVFKKILETPGFPELAIYGISNNFAHSRVGNTPQSNSVLPAWRDSLFFTHVDFEVAPGTSSQELMRLQAQMNIFEGWLRDLTPGSGGYMNEGTFDNPEWKQDFFGENYNRLLEIKEQYDPELVLYAHTMVGSDLFTIKADGRVCIKE
ncbi:hypothetical protein F4678DRAFT_265414 [Xylaria arbuscula]|nr:hypothetical protein F4678DRAFT_265414 [Xylaria arbuscula]